MSRAVQRIGKVGGKSGSTSMAIHVEIEFVDLKLEASSLEGARERGLKDTT